MALVGLLIPQWRFKSTTADRNFDMQYKGWLNEEVKMKSKFFMKINSATCATLCTFFLLLNSVYAAPGNLAQQPLFLGTTVQPNIFFWPG